MDHLIQDEKFSILVDPLEITELNQLLIDDDFYKIVAPDDESFLDIFTVEEIDSLKQDDIDELNK